MSSHRIHHARIPQLAEHKVVDETVWLLLVVGLNAAHKMRVRSAQRSHQLLELPCILLGDVSSALATTTRAAGDRVDGPDGEELGEDRRGGRGHAHLQILVQGVRVLLQPALSAVHDVSRKVRYDEGLLVCQPLPLTARVVSRRELRREDAFALTVIGQQLFCHALVV